MCGIAGIFSLRGLKVKQDGLKRMTDALSHRGPDGEGFWFDEDEKVGLGHRRLSIIDLSEAASQPMEYQSANYVITFNGEIYNYLELKNTLLKQGHYFQSDSDTEVLLAAYAQWGEYCLDKVDGMFAFAIWDKKKEVLFCARDRFGEKPFYYHADGEKFVFASELKALWAFGIDRSPSKGKVYDFLLFNTTSDAKKKEETFYEGIYSLPPSHSLILDKRGQLSTKNYWNIDRVKIDDRIELEEAREKFLELLNTSVILRMRSDVPIGCSLSGGLDSSSILSLVNRQLDKNSSLNSYSARFQGFELDEGDFIEKVLSANPNVEGNQIFISEVELQEQFDEVMKIQDEPFGSFSILAQNLVFKAAAKNGTKVMLDGQGADEYLAGYTYFFDIYYQELFRKQPSRFQSEIKAFGKHSANYQLPNFKERVRNRFPKAFKSLADFRRAFEDPESKLFSGLHPEFVREYRSRSNPRNFSSDLNTALKTATFDKGLEELLRYADRNSMSHSLEVRLPFLNPKLVNFVFSLPRSFLIHDAWSKFILRKAMESILPQEIVWRTDKVGFAAPQAEWMKEPLFRERLEQSTDYLKKEKIISSVKPNLAWNYVVMESYLNP